MSLLRKQDVVQAEKCLYQGQGTMMEYSADILVKGDAEQIFNCMQPELKSYERSSFTIKKTEEGVLFSIIAKDPVALRATFNSISQLLTVYEKTKELLAK